MLLAKRSIAQAGILATVGTVVLVLAGVLVGASGYLESTATADVRSTLASASPTDAAIRISTDLADDAEAQDDAAIAVIGRAFGDAPIEIHRSLEHFPRDVSTDSGAVLGPDGQPAKVVVAAYPGLAGEAELIDGAWPGDEAVSPDQPAPGALQASAAQELGLAVGDEVTIGTPANSRRVLIAATWLPEDPRAALWFGDAAVGTGLNPATGNGSGGYGPLVLAEANMSDLGATPAVEWTVVPAIPRVQTGDLAALAGGPGAVTAATSGIRDDPTARAVGDVVKVSGDLSATVGSIQRSLVAARGVIPVGLAVVGLIGAIALIQLSGLLIADRRAESALLRSRGATVRTLTAAALVEAAAVSVVGAAGGGLAAALLLGAALGGDAPATAPYGYAAAVAGFAVLVIGFATWRETRIPTNRERIDDSGRAMRAATLSAAVLAVVAAAFATWQALLYGTPVVSNADGSQSVNPLVVLAPPLGLIAASLIVLVAFGPLTSLLQRIAGHGRRLLPSYTAKQTARRIGAYAVCVLLLSLSVGGAVFASGYSATWSAFVTQTAQLASGADGRVDLDPDGSLSGIGATPLGTDAYAGLPGVTAAAPAIAAPIDIGSSDKAQLIALPADALGSVMSDLGGALDLRPLARALGGSQVEGIALPADATSLRLPVTVRPEAVAGPAIDWSRFPQDTTIGYTQLAIWLRDSDGLVTLRTGQESVTLGMMNASEASETSFPVPDGGTWELLGIDVTVQSNLPLMQTDVTISGIMAETAAGEVRLPFDPHGWQPQDNPSLVGGGSAAYDTSDGVLTVGLAPYESAPWSMRIMPAPGGLSLAGTESTLPIVVTRPLADHLALTTGKQLSFRLAGSGGTIVGEVAAVVPLIPGLGTEQGMLADFGSLGEYLLRAGIFVPAANQVWLSTDSPAAPDPAAVLAIAGRGAVVSTAQPTALQSLGGSAAVSLWFAGAGSLLLAAIAVAAVTLSLSRSRRTEVTVLRAVGVTARQQSRARFAELAAVAVFGIVLGAAAGAAAASLTVATLARSVVIGTSTGLPTVLRFDPLLGGAAVGVALAAVLVIAAAYAVRVKRQAEATGERLETR